METFLWFLSYTLVWFHVLEEKWSQKIWLCFNFVFISGYFLVNEKKVITLSYHVQASFINKKDKYLYG